jgi:hypothetical protein
MPGGAAVVIGKIGFAFPLCPQREWTESPDAVADVETVVAEQSMLTVSQSQANSDKLNVSVLTSP